jgi:hypothetical protein
MNQRKNGIRCKLMPKFVHDLTYSSIRDSMPTTVEGKNQTDSTYYKNN